MLIYIRAIGKNTDYTIDKNTDYTIDKNTDYTIDKNTDYTYAYFLCCSMRVSRLTQSRLSRWLNIKSQILTLKVLVTTIDALGHFETG